MNERKMIYKIQKYNQYAFEKLITQYSAYVSAVVHAIIGNAMSKQDIEEVTADVFVTVWEHPEKLVEGKVKSFLAGVARNKAKNKFRELSYTFSIEENDFIILDDTFSQKIDELEKSEILNSALNELTAQDREIFFRYYYYYQPINRISEETGIPISTITTKLSRGRMKLKRVLIERGYLK